MPVVPTVMMVLLALAPHVRYSRYTFAAGSSKPIDFHQPAKFAKVSSMNMNQVIIAALRHPLSVMVALVALAFGFCLAIGKPVCEQLGVKYPSGLPEGMDVDIFPALKLPIIYVAQHYGGMDQAQMEGYLTNYYDYHFILL